jgi:hypothetical protein
MNPRRKRGEVREDGKVFWCYNYGEEYWISAERFAVRVGKAREDARRWNRSNPEKRTIQKARWQKKYADRMSLYFKQWRNRNRDKVRELNREWRERNQERVTELQARKRARKRDAASTDSWVKAVRQIFEIARRVSKCLQIPHAVDHIYPLSRGGSHCHRNLQVLPHSLNQSKHARTHVVLPSCYRNDGWSMNGPASLGPK